jgi:putative glutathione S-transferase
MGALLRGVWYANPDFDHDAKGAFARPQSSFRDWIAPGSRFEPAIGRYHLYVSLACPWAHRALIFRRLKRLEGIVGLSVTHWLMGDEGWTFAPGECVTPDDWGTRTLHEVYTRADPEYSGRVTVPVLWDNVERTIVNNESAEIIRLFNSAFDEVGAAPGDYCPTHLLGEIEVLNERIYGTLNNGVYKAGFAKTQTAYDAAIGPLFETLDWLEDIISEQPYLCGETLTEADWRLFTTLVRFDAVYVGHFKCNRRRIADYPALSRYLKRLYHWPGVAETVNMTHIKRHYYMSHPKINPTGIVPSGPVLDFLG